MKNFLILILLIGGLGAGGYYAYTQYVGPKYIEYRRMLAGQPEIEQAKADLRRLKEKESRETAWIPTALQNLQTGLEKEIASGAVEVATSGSRIVVNITEQTLYQPGSKTFAKDSPNTLMKIASLLKTKDFESREILVGNTTSSVAAAGKGRRRTPAKDGRVLAGERSLELVKYFEKNGVNAASLAAVAYAPKMADNGFKIKEKKTVIVIGAMPAPAQAAAVPKPAAAAPAQQPKPAGAAPAPAQAAPATIPQQKPVAAPNTGAAQQAVPAQPQPAQPQQIQPKPIPVQPAQPK
ncbi:MAG TPA: hypothetical protein VN604_07390 [Nitrospirota bacterium]|nr:hypothetical protein [Nitrospirota bacterium]